MEWSRHSSTASSQRASEMRRPGRPLFRQVSNRLRTASRVGRSAGRGMGTMASLIGFPPLGLITDDTPDHQVVSRRLTGRTQITNELIERLFLLHRIR